MERTSESGVPIDPVYDASKLTDFRPEAKLGRPGECPFTRGAYPLVQEIAFTLMLRFHSQTAGVRLTAQQPEANLVRVSLRALAAVPGVWGEYHPSEM